MNKLLIIALAAVAFSKGSEAQTQPFYSTLFQTYNTTSKQTGYSQCNQSQPLVGVTPSNTTLSGAPMTPISDADAAGVTVDGVWFGGGIGLAKAFQVVGNCSTLQLTSNGGHGTTIYTGPVPLAPAGCTGSWYQSTTHLHYFVNITNTGFAWSVSLPTIKTVRAETACNGGYQYCPLAIGVPCGAVLNLPTTLEADGSPALASTTGTQGAASTISANG